MKIGLIGIHSQKDENTLEQLKNTLNQNLFGIFSPNEEEVLPFCKNFNLTYFSTAGDLFETADIIYFANSLKPNFDFAVSALKKSCHLFIEDISELSIEEIKQLFNLAIEAQIKIQIKKTYLFASEFLVTKSSISSPQLIEINQEQNFFYRPKNYFYEIFNDTCLAITETDSIVKKISVSAIPIDLNHFSLIYIRLDFDNGCLATIKYNNIAKEKKNEVSLFQSNQLIKVDFSNHTAIKHDIIHGQIITSDFQVDSTLSFDIELKKFIESIDKMSSSNISDKPDELYMIQVTQTIMERLYQILNPSFHA